MNLRLLNELPSGDRRGLADRIARLGWHAIGRGYKELLADVASNVAVRKDRPAARELSEAVEATDELGETD